MIFISIPVPRTLPELDISRRRRRGHGGGIPSTMATGDSGIFIPVSVLRRKPAPGRKSKTTMAVGRFEDSHKYVLGNRKFRDVNMLYK